jgi:hypothetical protein
VAECSTCGSESPRVRSRWDEKGQQLPDECPSCAPGSFEKFSNPSDKKIWMGYEAHPNEYVKAEDGGYDRKPEYRHELELYLPKPASDEQEATLLAVERKRRERRTLPMDSAEYAHALAKAKQIAEALDDSPRRVG